MHNFYEALNKAKFGVQSNQLLVLLKILIIASQLIRNYFEIDNQSFQKQKASTMN